MTRDDRSSLGARHVIARIVLVAVVVCVVLVPASFAVGFFPALAIVVFSIGVAALIVKLIDWGLPE